MAIEAGIAPFRIKDVGTWGPRHQKDIWYRGYVTYQNTFPSSNNIAGHVIIAADGGPTYIGYITGLNESDVRVMWEEIPKLNHTHNNFAKTSTGSINGANIHIVVKPNGEANAGQIPLMVAFGDEIVLLTIATTNVSSSMSNNGVYHNMLITGKGNQWINNADSSYSAIKNSDGSYRIKIALKSSKENVGCIVTMFNPGFDIADIYGGS